MTLMDLAERFKTPVKVILEDLEHIRRGLKGGARLVQADPQCLACGFKFRGRRHFNKPSRCPRCKSERISAPEFFVESRDH